jgi:RNA recognition motif-containing protein
MHCSRNLPLQPHRGLKPSFLIHSKLYYSSPKGFGLIECRDKEAEFSRSVVRHLELRQMEKKLYVGNLPFSVNAEKLKEVFSDFGEVSDAFVVKDRNTGRSRGFGFVTFADEEAADKAIAEMNGKELEGRELVVNEAKPTDR